MSGLTQLFLCQIIHTEHFSELLGKSLFGARNFGALRSFFSLGRLAGYRKTNC